MLRLPRFEVLRPGTVEETVALLARHGERCKLLAGGTDLVPNMKHRLFAPEVVVALSGVEELRGIEERPDGSIAIGAMTTLEECEHSALLREKVAGLAQSAAAVAGPSQRTMGTLGGNVCLDTRCVWYNQTLFWRQALGFCLKKDGSVCHVVAGGRSCVAAASNDTGTMLVALDATLEIHGPRGRRTVAIREFYRPDGIDNLRLARDELLETVVVPAPRPGLHSGYAKLRPRQSIDFPRLSVAVAYPLDDGGRMTDATVVVSAIAAVPRVIGGVGEMVRGRSPDDEECIAEVGRRAHRVVRPLTNIDGDADWRREMVPVFVGRAFRAAR